MRIVAGAIIAFICVCNNSDILELLPLKNNLFRNSICEFIGQHIFSICILWMVYTLFVEEIIRRVIIELQCRFEKRILPYFFTFTDIVSLAFSFVLIIFAVHSLMEVAQGIDVFDTYTNTYIFVLLYMVCILCRAVYINNSDRWCEIEREYTDYYDAAGKRIAIDDKVVYYGKRYSLKLINMVGTEDIKEKEWVLYDRARLNHIALEEAVKNKEGNLFIAPSRWPD